MIVSQALIRNVYAVHRGLLIEAFFIALFNDTQTALTTNPPEIGPFVIPDAFNKFELSYFNQRVIEWKSYSAPEDIILLTDPVVDNIIGSSRTLTKDLFFSGHTSTAFLFFLMARNRTLRYILLVNCIAIAVLLLWQHVHYTIDVVVAPIFAFFAYWIQGELTPFELNSYPNRNNPKT